MRLRVHGKWGKYSTQLGYAYLGQVMLRQPREPFVEWKVQLHDVLQEMIWKHDSMQPGSIADNLKRVEFLNSKAFRELENRYVERREGKRRLTVDGTYYDGRIRVHIESPPKFNTSLVLNTAWHEIAHYNLESLLGGNLQYILTQPAQEAIACFVGNVASGFPIERINHPEGSVAGLTEWHDKRSKSLKTSFLELVNAVKFYYPHPVTDRTLLEIISGL